MRVIVVLRVIVALTILNTVFGASAQGQQPAHVAAANLVRALDAYVEPYVRMRDFSGVVFVASRSRVVAQRTYGRARYELEAPISAATRFGIGSVTKTFTAAAVELLAERGQIHLNDHISKYLTGLSWGDSVSLEQLLAHSSGVPDYYGWPEYASHWADAITLDDFVHVAGAKPLDFKPGTGERYSNSGYKLLAAVVQRVSGMPFATFVRTQLLAPLGLEHTGDLVEGGLVPGLASGYDPGFPPARIQPATHVAMGWLEGNGSMYSTAGDLLKWSQVVAADSLVHTARLSYPYGWGKHRRFGRDVLEQDGRVMIGYTSYVGIYPKDSLAVIVLSNIQSQAVFQMGPDIAAIALGQAYHAPTIRDGAIAHLSVDSVQLQRLAGRYEVFPGFVLTVRATARGLLLAGPDGVFLPLDTEGRDRFFFRPLYVPIAFRTDTAGAATALLWAGSQECRRVN